MDREILVSVDLHGTLASVGRLWWRSRRGRESASFQYELAAMVDEALEPRDRRRVDAHLAGCEVCRALLADLREIRSLAATLEPIEPPARVRHDVRRRVAAGGRALRVAAGWWSWWSFGGAGPIRAPGLWSRWYRLRAGLARKLALLRTSAALGPEPIERRRSDGTGGNTP